MNKTRKRHTKKANTSICHQSSKKEEKIIKNLYKLSFKKFKNLKIQNDKVKNDELLHFYRLGSLKKDKDILELQQNYVENNKFDFISQIRDTFKDIENINLIFGPPKSLNRVLEKIGDYKKNLNLSNYDSMARVSDWIRVIIIIDDSKSEKICTSTINKLYKKLKRKKNTFKIIGVKNYLNNFSPKCEPPKILINLQFFPFGKRINKLCNIKYPENIKEIIYLDTLPTDYCIPIMSEIQIIPSSSMKKKDILHTLYEKRR